MTTITLDEALELFKLPRTLGEYEGKTVVANTGRFGPYINHDKKFVSIPKGEDPMEISLERAIELILSKREAEEKSHLKTFDEEPELESAQDASDLTLPTRERTTRFRRRRQTARQN